MNAPTPVSDLAGRAALVPAAITGGVGAAAAMLVVAYVLHLPGLALPGPVVGGAMLAALAGALALVARSAGRASAVPVGFGAGIVAALLSLIALGAVLAEPIEEHGALRGVLMFLVWTLLVGGVGAAAAALVRPGAPARPVAAADWTPILAFITAGAPLALITMGGIVTAAEAGLAVPDWPATFGANMFLYPLSQMTGGVYYEHAHRLMGAFVGLATILLMVVTLWKARGPVVKALSVVAFIHVCIQGLMGGLRVTELSTGLAIVHGVSAQLFLTLLLVIGLMTSRAWRAIHPAVMDAAGRQRAFSIAALAILFLQIALGAITRHLPGSNHPLFTHVGFSIIAAAAIVLAGSHAAKIGRDPVMKKLGTAHLHAVGLQMVLGVGALAVVILHGDAEQPTPVDLLVTTTHQVVGAILLGVVALTAVWSYRAIKPETRPAPALA